MRSLPASSAIGLPVVAAGDVVGRVADVILDRAAEHVAGFEVEAPDGRRLFLARAAAATSRSVVNAESPLHLVPDVGYYRQVGIPLAEADGDVEIVLAP